MAYSIPKGLTREFLQRPGYGKYICPECFTILTCPDWSGGTGPKRCTGFMQYHDYEWDKAKLTRDRLYNNYHRVRIMKKLI